MGRGVRTDRCPPSFRASRPPRKGPAPITFVGSAAGDAGPADPVEWARLHDDARGIAAALQARGVGPGVHVGVLGPTTRALVTTIQADLPRRGHRRVPAAAHAAGVDRGVRRADPPAHRQRRRRASWSSTPTSRRSSTRRPRDDVGAASCCSTSSLRDGTRAGSGGVGASARRPRAPGDPAVHERLDRRAQGRDAPRPLRRGEHRRHRRRRRHHRGRHGRCRGCRCTTTWASSGC